LCLRLRLLCPYSSVFNLGSASSLRSSLRILILGLFWVSRFRQILNIVSKFPWLEKDWKTLPYYLSFFVWKHTFLGVMNFYLGLVWILNLWINAALFIFICWKKPIEFFHKLKPESDPFLKWNFFHSAVWNYVQNFESVFDVVDCRDQIRVWGPSIFDRKKPIGRGRSESNLSNLK